MNLFDIFVRSPINRQTYLVTSQRNVAESEASLSRQELAELTVVLLRKQRLLKRVLQIETKAQHKTLMYKYNRGFKSFRIEKSPRVFLEYKRIGEQLERINKEICAIRTHAKIVRGMAA